MEIVFATHNNNKLKEVKQLLSKAYTIRSLNDINCHEEIVENADSVEDNALIKVKHVFENYGHACFADDTGLFVNALNGEPGVYSARYAGDTKNASANIDKLLENLLNQKDRSAYFKTVIAFKTNETEKLFTGICKGTIIESPKGNNGFGYDPVFVPEGHTETFAELSAETKNNISHRALAIKAFTNYLNSK
jgi:XTP/dITP diphosphohydrolase